MPEHYTKNTLECTAWCARCNRMTQHRVDGGRRGPCLEPHGPQVKVFADVKFPAGQAKACFHCDREFSPLAEAMLDWPILTVKCTACGCLTPFKVEPYRTKKQEENRRRQEQERRQPRLF